MVAETILIVEDELILAEGLRLNLEKMGYRVAGITPDGEEAVDLADRLRPDLVLMDIGLAGALDGVEAACQIRARFHLSIVYMTAHGDEETLARARLAEPAGYLLKPFSTADLRGSIEMALYKHQVEETLRESEQRYRTLVELSPQAIAVVVDGLLAFVNPSAVHMLRAAGPEQLVGRPFLGLVHENYRQQVQERVAWMLAGEWPSMLREQRWLCDDGTVVDVDVFASRVTYQGRPAIQVMAHDIGERKWVEAALLQAVQDARQRQAEVAGLLAAARAVLQHRHFPEAARAVYDVCRQVIGATAGYVALLSPEGDENEVLFLDAGGLNCTVDPGLPMPIRGLRAEAYRTGQAVYDNEFAGSTWSGYLPAGHVALHNVLFAPLVLDGQVTGLLGLSNKAGGFTADDAALAAAFGEMAAVAMFNSRTLEALESSEAVLAHQARELARSNANLEQFAYAVSHDLQEPLRMVSGYLGLLARQAGGGLDPTATEFLGFAQDGARRMREMIRALLDLSRVSTRGRELAAADCQAIMDRTLRHLQMAIAESGAEVTCDPLPVVWADEAQLSQVFQNLLSNACKFRGSEPPRVHVAARQGEGAWCFAVRDNGIGLAPDQAERIFEVFQRLHTQQEYPGLGIGLALCRRIVQRHGGRIWVESQPGAGATFFFTLPVVEET